MSTRCQIGFYSKTEMHVREYEILIYKHSDGYPEGVLPILVPFCKRFNKERGLEDTEYASAWLLYEFIADHIEHVKEFAKISKTIPLDGKDFLGHGICGDKQIHGDIEYFYAVYPDRVEVYEVNENWKLIQEEKW